ncbi:hypothetical protein V6N13_099819 [Hibiscus sabdariffa]|uniref:RING-type E3 ubiquitin transferase n=1 Tax=Hibiscus sabdariffa TaxID=183260 RepID=A0ABR1ZJV7_9ROSI
MGTCCSSFRIRESEEDVSCYQTRNTVHALWGKFIVPQFIGVNSNDQSDAPVLNSRVSAHLNSNAASNNIRSDNIVTLAPSVLHFEDDTAGSGEDKDHRRTKRREDSRDDHMEKDSQCEGRSTAHCTESQSKFSNEKPEAEVACAYGSSEDEDVCPTCLEEYDPGNPRIVLQCSHSYHLGCIYEWMERSANCPICGKVEIGPQETRKPKINI